MIANQVKLKINFQVFYVSLSKYCLSEQAALYTLEFFVKLLPTVWFLNYY